MADDLKTLIAELHAPARKPDHLRKVITTGINDCWGVDLMDFSKKADDGHHYALVVEDIFSRYAWVVPLKDKRPATAWTAFSSILRSNEKNPTRVWADSGKEFYGKAFADRLKALGIVLYSTFGDHKVAPVERFIGTLKRKYLWPQMELQGSYKWVGLLSDIVAEYNTTKHSSTGRTPEEGHDKSREKDLYDFQYGEQLGAPADTRNPFKIGDWVRCSVKKGVFERGYQANWSYQPYRIHKILPGSPNLFQIEERDGTVIPGSFYQEELRRTKVPDAGFVDILQTRTNKRQKEHLVSWRGVPSKYDRWMSDKDVRSLG